MKKNNKKSQRLLLVLFAVFVIPLLAAVGMIAMRDQLTLVTPSSHGKLIRPAQPITSLQLQTAAQNMVNKQDLLGKWTYVLYVHDQCNLDCEAALFKIRQARLAAGKDVNRVQYLLLRSAESASLDAALLSRHRQMLVGKLIKWETSASPEDHQPLQAGEVYLIDPLGNLMMRYSDSSTAKGMLKDLKKLLRISKIG